MKPLVWGMLALAAAAALTFGCSNEDSSGPRLGTSSDQSPSEPDPASDPRELFAAPDLHLGPQMADAVEQRWIDRPNPFVVYHRDAGLAVDPIPEAESPRPRLDLP